MWYLFLDESGDLGFDFVNKKPSKFFTVTILAMSSRDSEKEIAAGIKKTLRRKLNHRKNRQRIVYELKGSQTTIAIKTYFYDQVRNTKFGIYSITLNKKKVYQDLTVQKDRTYNWIARQVIDQIPFPKAAGTVQLIIDRSKSKPEIKEFNGYIKNQLKGILPPSTPLYIEHYKSHESPGLQAADLFCWGVFQKYERSNLEWYGLYRDKILFDQIYLK